MLTVADLEVSVLEFRQRSFQFDRLAELDGGPYAVFSRTETENERQLRPRLVRLTVVAPLSWVALDPEADVLRVGEPRSRAALPGATPVEVAAEPSEFEEDGRPWQRAPAGGTGFVYVPAERAKSLLTPDARATLGLA